MSIKGISDEWYVGKKSSNIISLLGRRTEIYYSNLSRIEFCDFKMGIGGGYLDFINSDGKKTSFRYRQHSNGKVHLAIDLIRENNPNLEILEHHPEDFRIYQRLWFSALMLFVFFPVGLFLIWHYKQHSLSIRMLITLFFLIMWMLTLYLWFPHAHDGDITLAEYNQCSTGMSYQDCANIIGSKGEPLAEASVLDTTSVAYVWYGDSAQMSAATFYFTNDKLTSKAQVNLK